jgi:hypothetical protein
MKLPPKPNAPFRTPSGRAREPAAAETPTEGDRRLKPSGRVLLLLAVVVSVLCGLQAFSPSAGHSHQGTSGRSSGVSGRANSSAFLGAQAGEIPCVSLVPEYERHLDRVVLSVPSQDETLEFHESLLAGMPPYTEVDFLVPRHRKAELQSWTDRRGFPQAIRWLAYDAEHLAGRELFCVLPDETGLLRVPPESLTAIEAAGTFWAQDLMQSAVGPDGEPVLFFPAVYRYLVLSRSGGARLRGDTRSLASLESHFLRVVRLPLAFKGGNVTADRLDGRTVLFVGSDVLATTRLMAEALGHRAPTAEALCASLRRWFSADKVVMVGQGRPQPVAMYHLDQAMLPLGGGRMAVPRVIGSRPRLEPDASRIRHVRSFLAELRTLLTDLGYRLVPIDTPVDHVLGHRHFVNAIAYRDRRTERATVLLPIFNGPDGLPSRDEPFSTNRRRLEEAGFDVVGVPTTADRLYGGIHCLIQVIQ